MLYIHLFGRLRLFVDGQPHPLNALPKTSSLLAYLLLHRAIPTPRETVAFMLWDDVPESESRANLRRHLYDLNRALPPAPEGKPWIVRQGQMIQWNPAAPVWLDVAVFNDLRQQPGRLTEAITQYTGDLLPEFYDEWLSTEREQLRQVYINTMVQLVGRERANQDMSQAIVHAKQLLAYDPLQEEMVRTLMELYYEVGDRAAALQVYQRFAERLVEELDVAPLPETAALYNTIRAGTAARTTLAPALPPPASAPQNLPAILNQFIGREADVAALIAHLLQPASARLLTITGSGGIGKTRLAVEVGRALWLQNQERFPDGSFFVGLAALTAADQVASAVAQALQITPAGNSPLLPAILNHLAPRHCLLIFDNFEHVPEAADLLAEIISHAPHVYLLVTSQTPLHLYGEQEYPLAPLQLPNIEALPPLAELQINPAVHLFVERLRAVLPNFVLDAENAPILAQICDRLEGIPLALELAAARGKLFPPAAMLAQLTRRLPFLTSQTRNVASRHKTLRATLDWSYNLLLPEEQEVFAQLAVLVGPFTLSTAEAIIPPPAEMALVEILGTLVDRNLLRTAVVRGAEEEPAFRLMHIVREYAAEQLATHSHAAETHAHHARHFADYAQLLDTNHRQKSNQTEWVRRLMQQEANLFAALHWLDNNLDQPASPKLLGQLVLAMERVWLVNGRVDEARFWLAKAVRFTDEMAPESAMSLLNRAGNFAQIQGDFVAAEQYHHQALAKAQAEHNEVAVAHTLHHLGNAAGRQGNYSAARDYLTACLAIYRTQPDLYKEQASPLLNNLAITCKRLGDLAQAAELYEESLQLKRARHDELGIATTLANMGSLALMQNNPAQAAVWQQESLAIRQKLNDRPGLVQSLGHLSELVAAGGDWLRAVRMSAALVRIRHDKKLPFAADARTDHEQLMEKARSVLGTAVMEAAWAEGETLSLEQALALYGGE